jgi:hypothetical protein
MATAAKITAADREKLFAQLEVPFDPVQIKWRIMRASNDGRSGVILPFADPRTHTDRLNQLFTPAGWTRKYSISAAVLHVGGIPILEVRPRTASPWLSDNQEDGVRVMRTYLLIGLAVVLGGLVLWLWRYQHRRAWSTRKQDETMRRHVNRNYD